MRFVRTVAALAAMLTAMLLQATVIAPLALPALISLPAVLVAAVALVDGPAVGMAFGFVAGLLADLGSSHPAGVLALAWTGLGVLCGRAAIGRSVRNDAVTTALCCTALSAAATILLAALHSGGTTVSLAVRELAPTFVGDVLIALVVVPVVRAFLRTETLRAPRPAFTELTVSRRG